MKGEFGDWPVAGASLGGALLALLGVFLSKILPRRWKLSDEAKAAEAGREGRLLSGLEGWADRIDGENRELRQALKKANDLVFELRQRVLAAETEARALAADKRRLVEQLAMRDGIAPDIG